MNSKKKAPPRPQRPKANSMLAVMKDGREFESLLEYQFDDINIVGEIRECLKEISLIRNRPVICYVANVVRAVGGSISIEDADKLPFEEMIASVPAEAREIDVVLVTPGGYAHTVDIFVNTLRSRFEKVGFIVLERAMSAGTIFVMSGDEIIMSGRSYIGPIDPQIRGRNGNFMPAQSLFTLIEEINDRGQKAINGGRQPRWSDIQILRGIDPLEIGNVMTASDYSIKLVKSYLADYKFRFWNNHSNGATVTQNEKETRANEIGSLLCNHNIWKNHGHAIHREAAWEVCRLKIEHSENIGDLDRIMRRLWALYYWMFDRMQVAKVFLSENYCVLRTGDINNQKK